MNLLSRTPKRRSPRPAILKDVAGPPDYAGEPRRCQPARTPASESHRTRSQNSALPPNGSFVRLSLAMKRYNECSMGRQEIFMHCPNGYGRTKLNNAFFERKLKMPATTRNWKTVIALYDMACCS